MRKKDIYINVMHDNFWWGIYNITCLTDWEYVIIYEKWGKGYRKIANTCICSKDYIRSSLKYSIEEDEDDEVYLKELHDFIDNDKSIYKYYYDKVEDKDFYEVPFEAERNDLNIKPCYIETWYPSDGIDRNVVEIVVKDFCCKFLNIEPCSIIYKDEYTKEMAQESYLKHLLEMQKCNAIEFTDDVIEQLVDKLGLSRDNVVDLLRYY